MSMQEHEIREHCGVFGIYNHISAANLTYLGLYALQHRGQESAGIVASDHSQLRRHMGMGQVLSVFNEKNLSRLVGDSAIGHNRYSTTGSSSIRNSQPLLIDFKYGQIALAHNGNISNYDELHNFLENDGAIFHSTVDSEVIVHLMVRSGEADFLSALKYALSRIKGAYSLLILTKDKLYAIRDPHGFRPLVMGELNNSIVFASETCAFDVIGATYKRDVKPGEIIEVSQNGITTHRLENDVKESLCIFEFIYFSRPDSHIFEDSVFKVRFRLGEILAEEHPADADLVMGVPDSSLVAAQGFAKASGIPYMKGMIRSHYIGRTFIEPKQRIRDFGARIKYNVIEEVVKDKRIVVVDDSIMRGTTAKKIVNMFRRKGAKEVHLRISSPPTRFPCYYGIDIPTSKELLASALSVKTIEKELEVNSLGYLSIEGMLKAVNTHKNNFCLACFNGDYPV